ncbi:MAG: ABC transporter substrate-binding protein [Rhizobiales bacterium]|nr:ABC transporter substrate-binding protein [Hyphomicrobiales bacterium]NRB12895.1 ABC transporter substrate-binding protein [Hyphomicrobiales bacterium]
MKISLSAALIIVSSIFSTSSASADCGKVSIADMNWNSATLFANVDKYILEKGYGCDVELVVGDTVATGTSMTEKGEPDIAPELWTNSFAAALEKGIEENRLRRAGTPLPDGGEEGFWVPKYLVDKHPELATIEGVRANAALFTHPEDKSKSALYSCPSGWACQISTGNLFKALNLADSNFELVDPGSGAALAGSMAKEYDRGNGWFGYYWAPTALLGKYEMVKVDFGTGVNEEHFKDCITKEDCVDPQPSMFPVSPISTITTEAFATGSPEVFGYLEKRGLSNADTNVILAWMEENQADGEIVAEYFLKNYANTWKQWVSDSAAEKITASLN